MLRSHLRISKQPTINANLIEQKEQGFLRALVVLRTGREFSGETLLDPPSLLATAMFRMQHGDVVFVATGALRTLGYTIGSAED